MIPVEMGGSLKLESAPSEDSSLGMVEYIKS